MGNAATFAVGAAAVIFLPDAIAMQSEALWETRENLRNVIRRFLALLMQGPLFELFAFLLRKCCCGRLASSCRPPHSLRAQALGSAELVLWWTARHPPDNPFHDEQYIVAWRLAPASGAAAAQAQSEDKGAEGEDAWHEELLTDVDTEERSEGNGQGGGTLVRRRRALVDALPPKASLRLRVCAVNRWGRSSWSKEEIEVDLPQQDRITERQAAKGLGRSRVVASDARVCIQCRTPQDDAKGTFAFADVVCRPTVVSSRDCRHGPFCARCHHSVSEQVLPACVCRALISAWRAGEAANAAAGAT